MTGRLLLVALLSLVLSGCLFRSPTKKAEARLEAVAKTEKRIDHTEQQQVDFAKANAYGVSKALDRAEKTPEVSVAYTLNDRVRLALGEPQAKDALEVDRIVAGLLSEEAKARQSAEKALAKRDEQLVGLQDRLVKLEGTLAKQEDKRDEQFVDFAGLATKFVRLRSWFWLGVGFLGVLFIAPIAFRILAILVPASGPVAGIFSSLFGAAGRTILKAVPAAAEKAGYVASEQFHKVQGALDDTVSAIQAARKIPHVRKELEPILADATDERVSRPVIREVKQRLKLRSV
jgi:hypothetical protein